MGDTAEKKKALQGGERPAQMTAEEDDMTKKGQNRSKTSKAKKVGDLPMGPKAKNVKGGSLKFRGPFSGVYSVRPDGP